MNENGFPIPRHLADQEIQYFIRELRNPTQHERNLFILYQLFTLTRRLVQMFVYTGFAGSYLDLFTQSDLQIALLTYIQAYDEFEVRANSLYNKLEQLYVFTSLQNYPSVNIDGQYVREILLYELEQNEGDIQTSYNPTFEVPLFSDELRMNDEQKNILSTIIANSDDLYFIYYSINDGDLQAKLQEQVINGYLLQTFHTFGYNPDSTEMTEFGAGFIPPQFRHFSEQVH
uniref:Uncharacterized protein n=1 Tax=Meloidogyne javanica TaxID=6303 RepID=A0A915M280_MELJA